jgi:hypothetical protein
VLTGKNPSAGPARRHHALSQLSRSPRKRAYPHPPETGTMPAASWGPSMFRVHVLAAAFAVLPATLAGAQYSGAIPNSGNDVGYVYGGIASYYANRRSPEEIGREMEIEANYRAALKKIPDKRPSNDPWKSVRQAPADRHTLPQ